jgi:hypothetical protein
MALGRSETCMRDNGTKIEEIREDRNRSHIGDKKGGKHGTLWVQVETGGNKWKQVETSGDNCVWRKNNVRKCRKNHGKSGKMPKNRKKMP